MTYHESDTLEKFHLLHECGRGAFGSVFLAQHPFYGKVALKIVYKNGQNCERELKGLRNYMSICKRTDLLQIYHVAENDDCYYYAMDVADDLAGDGEDYLPATLENRLKKEGRLPAEEVLKLYDELAAGLKVLHAHGACHRDLKPGNILWVGGRALPGDVGLVSDDTRTMLAGTPGFMRSDVLAGLRPFAPEDDFYALGKVLYCALTGNPPEKYPDFPVDATLTKSAEVVRLYNRLCAGEIVEPSPVRKPETKKSRVAAILACVAGFFLVVAAAVFAVKTYNAHLQKQAQEIAAQIQNQRPQKRTPPTRQKNETPGTAGKNADVLTDEEAVEKLHRELLAEWETYREKEKENIASSAKRNEEWEANFPEYMRADIKASGDRELRQSRDELETKEKNLPRLREVAKFYLRFFPEILKENREKEPFGYVCGFNWLDFQLNEKQLSPNRAEKEKQFFEGRKKSMEKSFGEARAREIERDGIYRAMRSYWDVEKILGDTDFEKTLRRYGEIFQKLP